MPQYILDETVCPILLNLEFTVNSVNVQNIFQLEPKYKKHHFVLLYNTTFKYCRLSHFINS